MVVRIDWYMARAYVYCYIARQRWRSKRPHTVPSVRFYTGTAGQWHLQPRGLVKPAHKYEHYNIYMNTIENFFSRKKNRITRKDVR